MTARFYYLGHPVPDHMLAKFPDGQVLFDSLSGRHVVRQRTTHVPLDRSTRLAARGVAA